MATAITEDKDIASNYLVVVSKHGYPSILLITQLIYN